MVENIFSESYFWSKIVSRFYNFINLTGYDAVSLFNNLSDVSLGLKYTSEFESTSILSYLLNPIYLTIFIITSIYIYLKFKKKIKLYRSIFTDFISVQYLSLFFVLIITQISIFFIKAPFFQICLGVALYPLLNNKILKKSE